MLDRFQKNKETTDEKGYGVEREYYGSPSYDGHAARK